MNDRGDVEKAKERRTPTLPSVRSRAERGSSLDRLIGRIDAARGDTAIGAGHRAGAQVRTMRVEAGLSQHRLAEALGISQARVSEIEAGVGPHGPTWDLMERVAAACGRRIGILPLADASLVTADDIDVDVIDAEIYYGQVSGRFEKYAVDIAGPDFMAGSDFNLRFEGGQSSAEEEGSAYRGRRFGGRSSPGKAGTIRTEGRMSGRPRPLDKPA
jgi:transcriptional regulator with XRE-family HTH domain